MDNNKCDYTFLDSGQGKKLEQFGPIQLIRPASQAIWEPKYSPEKWNNAHAEFFRDQKGNGEWIVNKKLPESWVIQILGISLIIKPTSFGHLGIFPEALNNWNWIKDRLSSATSEYKVLSLFSYTGAYSLICALMGAEVCHVDASKTIVKWAKQNSESSGLQEKPIRWIIDDARKFIKREIKRGAQYDAIIMDPPTYGRGFKGELWKIESDLPELIELSVSLLKKNPDFIMVNTYAGDITNVVVENLIKDAMPADKGHFLSNEMVLKEKSSDRLFPNGLTTIWQA